MHSKFVENHFWVLGQNDKMIKVLHGGSLWAPKSCYLTYVRPLIRQIQACYDVGNSGADSEPRAAKSEQRHWQRTAISEQRTANGEQQR